nr:hypothetical protein [Tanacetum cinerariifolium]
PNCEALRKCILSGPYKPKTILVQAVEATDDSLGIPEHTRVKTQMNMSLENKDHFLAEKEAIHLILTGIRDEIYLTIDACQTAQEMWEAIERLQQGESLNIQDVKTNLFWEFGKFTSHDGESMESYYTRFYKLMNEMTRNNLTVTTIHKGNEIAKPITPPSETDSKEDNNPEQAQRDKDMQKNLALIAKYFKKIYKPINNNLRTSSNSKNKNVDTTPREFRHFANECRKLKRYDWLADTDEEVDEQELEAHYSYMAKIQEVPTANSGIDSEPVEQVQNDAGYNVFANHLQHSEQSESVSNTCSVETDDKSDDERVVLANLKPDVDENKKIQKKLKKANTTLARELKECKAILAETSKSLGESTSVRDSCLVALQTNQTEFEKYKAFNDRTIDYDKLERKLNKALGQLAQKDTVIKEGLKTKAYELSVVKEKHDELMKQSLLTKSHYEGLVKQKTKVPTYNGRPTFANPRYLKQGQSEIPCLYAFPYDQNTHANRLILDGEETLALERESRSKLNKDLVRPYDYTTLNSLYEIFEPPTQENETQLVHANEIRRKMWRKSFVKSKPNIYKNVGFLPVSKSISKSRQAYNVMTNNTNDFKEIVDNSWIKHSKDQFHAPTTQDMKILIQTCLMPLAIKTQNHSFKFVHELKHEMHANLKHSKDQFRAPTAHDMEILIQTCLMPLAIKTQNDSFKFVHELKQEMHVDLKYVESLEKEIDELESDKAEFSDMYDVIL